MSHSTDAHPVAVAPLRWGLRCAIAIACLLMQANAVALVAPGQNEVAEPPAALADVGSGSSGWADPQAVAELTEARLAALRDADSARRVALLEAVADQRERLLHEHPTDPRRGRWLADGAEDLLLGRLPATGLDLTCLVGWPGPDERRAAAAIAERSLRAIRHARDAIDETLRQIAGIPGADADAALDRFRTELADRERAARLPALEGLASGLLAATLDDQPRATELRHRVRESLWPILIELDETPRVLARAQLALALAHIGSTEDARGVLRALAADTTSNETDRLWIALAPIAVIERLDGPRAALDLLDRLEFGATDRRPTTGGRLWREPFVRLLLNDARVRLLTQLRDRAATRVHGDLLASLGAEERGRMRPLLLGRLGTRLPAERSEAALPSPEGALGDVAAAARDLSDGVDLDVVAARLTALVTNTRLAPVERTAAGLVLMDALAAAQRDADVALAGLTLARAVPGELEAPQAIELAAGAAFSAWRRAPDHASGAMLRETIATLLDRFPSVPSAERWRHELARVALFAREDGKRSDELLRSIVDATPRDSPWRGETELLLALSRRPAAAPDARHVDLAEWRAVLELADGAAASLAEAPDPAGRPGADAWTVARSALARDQAAILRGEALVVLGNASVALDAVAGVDPATLPPAAVADLLGVRIAAYQSTDRDDLAAIELDRFAEIAPDRAWRTISAMIGSVRRRIEDLRDQMRDDEADRLVRRDLGPLASVLERLLDAGHVTEPSEANASGTMLTLRWQVAEAALEREDHARALHQLDRLLVAQPDAAEFLLARATALEGLQTTAHLAEAMTLLKRVSAARAAQGDAIYWRAEIAMLRILIGIGRGADQARPRIAQLRARDPQLGGERWRRQIEHLDALSRR